MLIRTDPIFAFEYIKWNMANIIFFTKYMDWNAYGKQYETCPWQTDLHVISYY